MMPPDRVIPHDKFGFFVGKNESLETGEFTVFTGRDSPKTYGIIDNWNGINRMDFWKTEECNSIKGTDGTAFPPGLLPAPCFTCSSRICAAASRSSTRKMWSG